MSYRYIQINTITGNIIADSYLSEELNLDHLIPVSEDFDPTNKKYDFEINDWVYYEPTIADIPISEPTQLDRIEAAINLSQQEIIDNYTLELIESGAL